MKHSRFMLSALAALVVGVGGALANERENSREPKLEKANLREETVLQNSSYKEVKLAETESLPTKKIGQILNAEFIADEKFYEPYRDDFVFDNVHPIDAYIASLSEVMRKDYWYYRTEEGFEPIRRQETLEEWTYSKESGLDLKKVPYNALRILARGFTPVRKAQDWARKATSVNLRYKGTSANLNTSYDSKYFAKGAVNVNNLFGIDHLKVCERGMAVGRLAGLDVDMKKDFGGGWWAGVSLELNLEKEDKNLERERGHGDGNLVMVHVGGVF